MKSYCLLSYVSRKGCLVVVGGGRSTWGNVHPRSVSMKSCRSKLQAARGTPLGGAEFPGVDKEMEIGQDWCLQMSRGWVVDALITCPLRLQSQNGNVEIMVNFFFLLLSLSLSLPHYNYSLLFSFIISFSSTFQPHFSLYHCLKKKKTS